MMNGGGAPSSNSVSPRHNKRAKRGATIALPQVETRKWAGSTQGLGIFEALSEIVFDCTAVTVSDRPTMQQLVDKFAEAEAKCTV